MSFGGKGCQIEQPLEDAREKAAKKVGIGSVTLYKVGYIEEHARLRLKAQLRAEQAEAPPFPSGQFQVVYADPPWKYY
jgi:hypothetical protein